MPELRRPAELQALAKALRGHNVVEAASAHPDADQPDRVVVEMVLVAGIQRVPPDVHRTLALHDAGTRDVTKHGDQLVVEVV